MALWRLLLGEHARSFVTVGVVGEGLLMAAVVMVFTMAEGLLPTSAAGMSVPPLLSGLGLVGVTGFTWLRDRAAVRQMVVDETAGAEQAAQVHRVSPVAQPREPDGVAVSVTGVATSDRCQTGRKAVRS
jgi:hypothetical protein